MKKIGILTINDYRNLGNRLQNFATQRFLEEQGILAETIQNMTEYGKIKYKIKKYIKRTLKYILKRNSFYREINFSEFNKKYIKMSKYKIEANKINKGINEYYDFFVAGSDQVWNPNFPTTTDAFFLTFADKTKRISFSASFGVDKIPVELNELYTKRLNGLNKISVREEQGKKIIKELTGRNDVTVLLDPTMLINKESWNEIVKKPKYLEKINYDKYILIYFLGELSDERKKEIQRVAKKNNCKIINILDKNSPFYSCGPREFLYLEKNSFLVCTDSFHSSVFAILFNTPLVVFDREDSEMKMNSRLDTLLKKFSLEDKWFNNTITDDMLKANYYEVDKVLKSERKKAREFIKKALN